MVLFRLGFKYPENAECYPSYDKVPSALDLWHIPRQWAQGLKNRPAATKKRFCTGALAINGSFNLHLTYQRQGLAVSALWLMGV